MNDKIERAKRARRGLALALTIVLALALPAGLFRAAEAEAASAEIGGVLYGTLGEAVGAVAEGETIRLLAPVQIDHEIETGRIDREGIRFTLDLNGYSITGKGEGSLLTIVAGKVTLHNGILDNSASSGGCVLLEPGKDAEISVPSGGEEPDWTASSLTLVPGYPVTIQWEGPGQVYYDSAGDPPLVNGATLFLAGGGASHRFLFRTEAEYTVKQMMRNGVSLLPAEELALTDLNGPTTLFILFDVKTFVLEPKVFAGEKTTKRGAVVTPRSQTVAYGDDAHFDFTVSEGYRLRDVLVDGVSIGPVTSFDVTDVREDRDIRILLDKTAFFIMLDAGHFAYYNHSPVVSSYYEGNEMWTFHLYLKAELEKYPDVIVGTTRKDNSKALGLAMGPFDRGAAGEDYDLVLSLHSNATSQESINHVVGIYTRDPALTAVSKGLGDTLTATVTKIMGITQAPKVYTRAQSDGRDWYGVNRGAASVGVPSLILEHSFHTNTKATNWLLVDSNKRALAVAEAQTIAAYYGLGSNGEIVNPGTPARFTAYGYSYNSNMVKWQASAGATSYQVYRSASAAGPYALVKTTTALSILDPGLTCGKQYYYKVRACRASATGTKYSSFSPSDLAVPVPAATKVSLVPGNNKMTVKWTKVSGASGYVIFRAAGSSTTYTRVKTLSGGSTLQWTQTGLRDKYTYKYKVRAYRVSGGKTWYSPYSVPVGAKTQ